MRQIAWITIVALLVVSEKFDRMKDHPDIAKRLEAKAKQFYAEISRQVRPLGNLEEK